MRRDKAAKALIACEESQAVTIELRRMGIEAYSCDLLPCSGGHPEWHIQQDVTPLLQEDWDMVIAFPPCHDIAVSGTQHFKRKQADGSQQAAIDFFLQFARLDCPRVAIENPVNIIGRYWRKPDQTIQPYWFGDPYQKTTCLWLKGLPRLVPTKMVERGPQQSYSNGRKSIPEWISNAPHKDRRIFRSKTFPGIARAMAQQWGGELLKPTYPLQLELAV